MDSLLERLFVCFDTQSKCQSDVIIRKKWTCSAACDGKTKENWKANLNERMENQRTTKTEKFERQVNQIEIVQFYINEMFFKIKSIKKNRRE